MIEPAKINLGGVPKVKRAAITTRLKRACMEHKALWVTHANDYLFINCMGALSPGGISPSANFISHPAIQVLAHDFLTKYETATPESGKAQRPTQEITPCKIEFTDKTLYDRVQKCCFDHDVFWRADRKKEGKFFNDQRFMFIDPPVITSCLFDETFFAENLPQISPEDFLAKYEQVEIPTLTDILGPVLNGKMLERDSRNLTQRELVFIVKKIDALPDPAPQKSIRLIDESPLGSRYVVLEEI